MSTKTKTKIKRTETNELEELRLPELWERFKEATGKTTRCPNRTFLVRRIQEALAARAHEQLALREEEFAHSAPSNVPSEAAPEETSGSEPEPATTSITEEALARDEEAPQTASSNASSLASPEATPEPETPTTMSTPPRQRGRFTSMTIEDLQTTYLATIGRATGSDDRRYLIWKIRSAEKGRIPVGPRRTRQRQGEPLDVKIIPLRIEADVVQRMDEVWRSRGIKSRMEFFRRVLGHYLTQLGATDAAMLFTGEDSASA